MFDNREKMRQDFWAGKEKARLEGELWIKRFGTDAERRELMGSANDG